LRIERQAGGAIEMSDPSKVDIAWVFAEGAIRDDDSHNDDERDSIDP
jgi:hypothetical protein